MNSRLRALPALLVAAAAAFAPVLAQAQMIPIEDLRTNAADVTYFGVTQALFEDPPAPFAYFDSFLNPFVYNPDPNAGGHCEATAFQVSEFFPAGINASGSTTGGWAINPGGNYSALSFAYFGFRVDTCIEYQLDSWLLPGDLGESRIDVAIPNTNLAYQDIQSGEIHTTGRLPAGNYQVEGKSYIISDREYVDGPSYSIIWTCRPCITTLVAGQPRDVTVACGGTAVFSVAATGPLAGLTFQWRRNLIPLANSGHVAGATTQTLSINNACVADSGYYDVVLSDGTILEPSRLARLSVNTISGVEVPAEGPPRAFSIQAAGPNPFVGQTSFHYVAAKPLYATIAIYNAAGARIRSLAKSVLSGSGTVTWDGETDAGARAPAGIYFLRVEAGSIRESRKVVLVR